MLKKDFKIESITRLWGILTISFVLATIIIIIIGNSTIFWASAEYLPQNIISLYIILFCCSYCSVFIWFNSLIPSKELNNNSYVQFLRKHTDKKHLFIRFCFLDLFILKAMPLVAFFALFLPRWFNIREYVFFVIIFIVLNFFLIVTGEIMRYYYIRIARDLGYGNIEKLYKTKEEKIIDKILLLLTTIAIIIISFNV